LECVNEFFVFSFSGEAFDLSFVGETFSFSLIGEALHFSLTGESFGSGSKDFLRNWIVSCFIDSFVAFLAGECVGVTTDLAAERRVFLLTGILQASFFLSDRVFVLTIWNFEVVFLGDLEEILLFYALFFVFLQLREMASCHLHW
jgi:hypothetical protein